VSASQQDNYGSRPSVPGFTALVIRPKWVSSGDWVGY